MPMFLTDMLLNMLVMGYMATVTASIICIAAIILSRIKVPAYITFFMWSVILIRLISPISFSLDISPYHLPFVNNRLVYFEQLGSKYFDTNELTVYVEGMPNYDRAVKVGATPRKTHAGNAVFMEKDGITPAKTLNETGLPFFILLIWFGGILVIWSYNIISYVILKRRIKTAVLFQDNIYLSEHIKSPFVLGIFAPRIYLPYGLEEEQRNYIVLHEKNHIARRDYILKPFVFGVCSLYWYNAYLWAAFRAFIEQMEISCDELVIKKLGSDAKEKYSQTILDYAIRFFGVNSIAFGEVGTKIRIKNIMKYKKPGKAKVTISIIICVLLCVFCLANPMP